MDHRARCSQPALAEICRPAFVSVLSGFIPSHKHAHTCAGPLSARLFGHRQTVYNISPLQESASDQQMLCTHSRRRRRQCKVTLADQHGPERCRPTRQKNRPVTPLLLSVRRAAHPNLCFLVFLIHTWSFPTRLGACGVLSYTCTLPERELSLHEQGRRESSVSCVLSCQLAGAIKRKIRLKMLVVIWAHGPPEQGFKLQSGSTAAMRTP